MWFSLLPKKKISENATLMKIWIYYFIKKNKINGHVIWNLIIHMKSFNASFFIAIKPHW